MSDEIKIDKKVPMPDPSNGHGRAPLHPFREMRVGDSFFTKHARGSLSNSVTYFQYKLGWKFVTRKEGDGTRVWRVS